MSERWQDRAICSTSDKLWWISPYKADQDQAKEVCGVCPVKSDCLAFALDSSTTAGIWAGLNFNENSGDKQKIAQARRKRRKHLRERFQ